MQQAQQPPQPLPIFKKVIDHLTSLDCFPQLPMIHQMLLSSDDNLNKQIGEFPSIQLNSTEPFYQLTPLHISIMIGSHQATQLLLQKNVRVDIKDYRHWTPLHHASISSDEFLIQLLKDHSSKQNIQIGEVLNEHGGSCRDLMRMISSQQPKANVFHYLNENQKIISGSTEDFLQMTSSHYIQELKFTPEELIEEWLHADEVSQDINEHEISMLLRPLYFEFLNSPPQLFIDKVQSDGIHAGHGLFTQQHIRKGTLVVEYLGERLKSNSSSNYRWGKIDAQHYRNMAAMCNDGFPNLVALPLYHIRGVAERILFVAIEDISAHDMLCIHYGKAHSVKLMDRLELRLKELIFFFQKNSPTSILNDIIQMGQQRRLKEGWDYVVHLESLITKLHYLYQTPTVLFYLLWNQILDIDEITRIFNDSRLRYCLLGFNDQHASSYEHKILKVLKTIFQFFHLKKQDPFNYKKHIENTTLPHLSQLTSAEKLTFFLEKFLQ